MEKENNKKKVTPLKKFILFSAFELVLLLAVVLFFDPFYQYHTSLFGPEVLNDRDNQMPGTIRNFDYDSVIIGTSLMENCNTAYLDNAYGIKTLKVVRAGSPNSDLLYYMNMVHEVKAKKNTELKKVFWCMDVNELTTDTAPTLRKGNDTPWYLHTKSPLDDVTYLCNKEIILKTIPKNLMFAKSGINTGENAYNWARDKDFSVAKAMTAYTRPSKDSFRPMADFSEEIPVIQANISNTVAEVNAHPETEYIFFYPPHSIIWWDSAYVNGLLDRDYYVIEESMKAFLDCPNAKVYFYMDMDEILDLDNYMDMVHFIPEMNQAELEGIVNEKGRVTKATLPEYINSIKNLVDEIETTHIYKYYED